MMIEIFFLDAAAATTLQAENAGIGQNPLRSFM